MNYTAHRHTDSDLQPRRPSGPRPLHPLIITHEIIYCNGNSVFLSPRAVIRHHLATMTYIPFFFCNFRCEHVSLNQTHSISASIKLLIVMLILMFIVVTCACACAIYNCILFCRLHCAAISVWEHLTRSEHKKEYCDKRYVTTLTTLLPCMFVLLAGLHGILFLLETRGQRWLSLGYCW